MSRSSAYKAFLKLLIQMPSVAKHLSEKQAMKIGRCISVNRLPDVGSEPAQHINKPVHLRPDKGGVPTDPQTSAANLKAERLQLAARSKKNTPDQPTLTQIADESTP